MQRMFVHPQQQRTHKGKQIICINIQRDILHNVSGVLVYR